MGKGKGKGKVKGKNNNNQCPSFDDLLQMAEEEYATETCILQTIGWIDADGNVQQDTIDADECVDKMVINMEEELGDCADNFSDEEQTTPEDLAVKIASFECFMEDFQSACNDYIENDVVNYVLNNLSTILAAAGTNVPGGR